MTSEADTELVRAAKSARKRCETPGRCHCWIRPAPGRAGAL